jgi:hypothetical protein
MLDLPPSNLLRVTNTLKRLPSARPAPALHSRTRVNKDTGIGDQMMGTIAENDGHHRRVPAPLIETHRDEFAMNISSTTLDE